VRHSRYGGEDPNSLLLDTFSSEHIATRTRRLTHRKAVESENRLGDLRVIAQTKPGASSKANQTKLANQAVLEDSVSSVPRLVICGQFQQNHHRCTSAAYCLKARTVQTQGEQELA